MREKTHHTKRVKTDRHGGSHESDHGTHASDESDSGSEDDLSKQEQQSGSDASDEGDQQLVRALENQAIRTTSEVIAPRNFRFQVRPGDEDRLREAGLTITDTRQEMVFPVGRPPLRVRYVHADHQGGDPHRTLEGRFLTAVSADGLYRYELREVHEGTYRARASTASGESLAVRLNVRLAPRTEEQGQPIPGNFFALDYHGTDPTVVGQTHWLQFVQRRVQMIDANGGESWVQGDMMGRPLWSGGPLEPRHLGVDSGDPSGFYDMDRRSTALRTSQQVTVYDQPGIGDTDMIQDAMRSAPHRPLFVVSYAQFDSFLVRQGSNGQLTVSHRAQLTQHWMYTVPPDTAGGLFPPGTPNFGPPEVVTTNIRLDPVEAGSGLPSPYRETFDAFRQRQR